jgi:HSP20 family protein
MQRWDPWNEMLSLREAMNNLLEESFVRPRGGATQAGGVGLAVDVREDADTFTVKASVPGVDPADVDITVLGDTVRIHGERRSETEREGGEGQRWLVRERSVGTFDRAIALPTAVDPEGANAEFKDGVLTITLPKAETAKPRSIPVRGAGSQPQAIDVEGRPAAESEGSTQNGQS